MNAHHPTERRRLPECRKGRMAVKLFVLASLLGCLAQDGGVRVEKNLTYYDGEDADPRKHKLDLYLPKTDEPFPVVMWIHGGAWMAGDRWQYGALGRRFAERGIGMAVISYRLSPAVRHPEHVKDCARAFAWLYKNVREYGGDPHRLFVSGQSAGGHLTALLALNRKYLDAVGVPRHAIQGAIPISGVYEIPVVRDERGPLGIFKKVFGSDPEVCRDASPIEHVQGCRVPLLVITETEDTLFLRPGMRRFKKALEKAKVRNVRFMDAEGRNHISIVVQMMRKGDDPVRDAIIDFVKERCAELDSEY